MEQAGVEGGMDVSVGDEVGAEGVVECLGGTV